MRDFLYELVSEWGLKVGAWLASLLLAVMAAWVWKRIRIQVVRDVLERAWTEIVASALQVWQTYVQAIKEGRADGKLTPEEATEARRRALDAFKRNFGLAALAKAAPGWIFGAKAKEWAEGWADHKLEAAVAKLKADGVTVAASPSASEVAARPLT
jgi:hypothetical protein